ncbi:MAG TPA: YhjD/YihY/BrkB family envelope integrity protein [Gammaproteobacteria bacterium]
MSSLWQRAEQFLFSEIWRIDLNQVGYAHRVVLRTARFLLVIWHELAVGQINLRAMSLVYTTLLSMVPLIAVSFSVLKAFGVHNQVEPLLLNLMAPLGAQADEIVQRILGFVANMKVGVLGSLGMALLIYTVISLIQKVENSFNYVWRTKGVRSFARRFSDYLSVIMVGPVLIFAALGLTATMMNSSVAQRLMAIEPFGSIVVVLGEVMPFLMITAAFCFIYIFVPNTRVRFRSALVGAAVAGVIWQLTGKLFASFASGAVHYSAIYSGLAILMLFMIWLYLAWVILLFGAQVAYFHQHPEQIRLGGTRLVLSNRLRERLALTVMTLVADSYCNERAPWTLERLVQRLRIPGDTLGEVVDLLQTRQLLVETGSEPPEYLPAHNPEGLTIARLLTEIREAGEEQSEFDASALALPAVDDLFGRLQGGMIAALDGLTLKALVTLPSAMPPDTSGEVSSH